MNVTQEACIKCLDKTKSVNVINRAWRHIFYHGQADWLIHKKRKKKKKKKKKRKKNSGKSDHLDLAPGQ